MLEEKIFQDDIPGAGEYLHEVAKQLEATYSVNLRNGTPDVEAGIMANPPMPSMTYEYTSKEDKHFRVALCVNEKFSYPQKEGTQYTVYVSSRVDVRKNTNINEEQAKCLKNGAQLDEEGIKRIDAFFETNPPPKD